LEIVDPTEEELNELNLYLGYDEFMDWSGGIFTGKNEKPDFNLFDFLSSLFKKK